MNWKKEDLVEHILCLIHNNNVLHDTLDTQAQNYINATRWIPVSERLPDESDYYCVTTEDTETGDRVEQTIWFSHKDDYYIEESEWRELADYEKVIAWRKHDPYSLKE